MSLLNTSADRSGPQPAAAVRSFAARTALCAVLAATLLVPALAASETPPEGLKLEQIVPNDTILFVKCSGIDRLIEESRSLDLFKLWAEPEIQAFFADTLEMLPGMLGGHEEQSVPFQELWELVRGDFSLACSGHLAVFEEGALPSLALAMDMGPDPEAFLARIDSLLGMASGMADFEQGKLEYRGFDISVIDLPPERLEVCHTTIQNLFVAAVNRYYLKEIIDSFTDNRSALSQNPAFRKSMKRVGGGAAGASIFLNLDPICSAVRPFCPYEAKEWLAMLGLDGIDAICYATALEGGGSRDSLFIHCPGSKKGLLKALVIDPELILAEIDGFVQTALPEHYEEYRSIFAMVNKEAGFDLEKDLFGPLGSEVSFFVNMPPGGGMALMPEIILSVDLDDEARFAALLDKVLVMLEIEVSETTFEGLTLRYFNPFAPAIPLSPAFVVDGGRLLVSGSPITLKKHLKRLSEGGPGLDTADAFREVAAGIPDNASLLEYVNVRRLVGMIYENAAPFLPALLAECEMPLDTGMLPMSETITRNISNGYSYMVMDEDGILMSGRWSLGFGSLLATAASVADFGFEKGYIPALLMGGGMEMEEPGEMEFLEEEEPLDPELEAAFSLMEEEQYAAAEAVFTGWIKTNADDGLMAEALANRGYCRMALKQYDDAVADYEKVMAIDPDYTPLACYNIACAYSVRNKKGKALDYLNRAIEAGFDDFEYMAEDQDLNNIRELITIPESMKKPPKPMKKP